MQAVLSLVSLLFVLKLGSIQAAPVVERDVDLRDPTILREDIDDMRWDLENVKRQVKSQFDTTTRDLQGQIDLLSDSVRDLQDQVAGLGGWRSESDSLRERIQEAVADLYQVNNHVNALDDVVLQHHPENYAELGYQLNPAYTPSTETVATEESPAVEIA